MRVALIAHDKKKEEMVNFAKINEERLSQSADFSEPLFLTETAAQRGDLSAVRFKKRRISQN